MILFIKSYFYCKDLSIQISKGKDAFFIANKTDIEWFSKKEMECLKMYNTKGRSLWSLYTIIELRFNNGRIIQLPNLLINSSDLWAKMPEVRYESEDVILPYIRGRYSQR
jgi:hypothetical protein